MAYQPLNLGTSPDDGNGDPLRTGGDKINDNFVELYAIVVSAKSANTIFAGPSTGAAAAPTFRSLVAADMPAGVIQDLDSVLGQGSTASITTPFSLTVVDGATTNVIESDEDGITLSSTDGVDQMGIEVSPVSVGLGNGTNGITISAAGVVTQTPAPGTDNTEIATTAFVVDAITGAAQDLDSVMNQGSSAAVSTTIDIETSEDFYLRTTGAGKIISLQNLDGGSVEVTSVPVFGAGGVTYPWPSAAPAGNGYALVSQTDGTLSWAAVGVGTVTSVGFTGGLISVANPSTTPAFTVAGTSGGIPYFSSASTWASSAALAANAIVIGGGAGAAPTTTTTGTGVLTALGVNVGSLGAFLRTNLTDTQIFVGNGSGIATGVAMSGEATLANTGAVTLSNAAVIAKVLTGYVSGAGTVAATDTILQAIQKLDGNDALGWKVTGTSTLTGNTIIANGGNTLAFSGAGTHSFSSTSATVAGNFTVTSTYTVPAGVAVSAYGSVFNGTMTGKGTANDLLCMVRVSGALNNSTGAAVSHVSLRVDTTHGGSITPAASIGIQVVAGNSTSIAEILRGVNSSGQTTHQLYADGRQVWTTKTTGSDFGGSMASNAANGAGHLAMSFQLSGSATTAHTHFGVKATGGMTTNATNATYNSFWDARSLVANHTGFIGYGFRYAPVVTGTQAGTEVLYAFIAESGLSGFQCASNAPTAIVHIGASTTAHASLRIDSGTAPSSTNDGDIWFDGADIKMRIGGVTKTFTLI